MTPLATAFLVLTIIALIGIVAVWLHDRKKLKH
jgi:hypothetical protein